MIFRATFLFAAVAVVSGCASVTTRPVEGAEPPAHPAGVLQMVWRTTLHEHGLFEPDPEECATGALAAGHLVIGSRASNIVGVVPETGHVDWVTGVSGGVDSKARLAELRSNPADAKRIYHEGLDKSPTTSLREEITNRLAALEMK